jgi:hypothetical protein
MMFARGSRAVLNDSNRFPETLIRYGRPAVVKKGIPCRSLRSVTIVLLNAALVIAFQTYKPRVSPSLNSSLSTDRQSTGPAETNSGVAVHHQTTKAAGTLRPNSTAVAGSQSTTPPESRPQAQRPNRTTRAIVVDDRLSALRREPNLKSVVVRRLSPGRRVWIIFGRASTGDQPSFYRVAVTRRTSGWIHASALAVPGRAGEDHRLLALIEATQNSFERIRLCTLFAQNFSGSRLLPRVLLVLGEEADRAADSLRIRDITLPPGVEVQASPLLRRAILLTDSRLDRFSRIGVSFDLSSEGDHYVYDGRAYRQILSRYPGSEAALKARERLGR